MAAGLVGSTEIQFDRAPLHVVKPARRGGFDNNQTMMHAPVLSIITHATLYFCHTKVEEAEEYKRTSRVTVGVSSRNRAQRNNEASEEHLRGGYLWPTVGTGKLNLHQNNTTILSTRSNRVVAHADSQDESNHTLLLLRHV